MDDFERERRTVAKTNASGKSGGDDGGDGDNW
jgi:hypothetical protein